jgi:hypothetical protein
MFPSFNTFLIRIWNLGKRQEPKLKKYQSKDLSHTCTHASLFFFFFFFFFFLLLYPFSSSSRSFSLLFFSFFLSCVYQHFIKTININTFYLNIYTSTHVYVFITTNSSWRSITFEAFPLIQIVSLCIEQLKKYIESTPCVIS